MVTSSSHDEEVCDEALHEASLRVRKDYLEPCSRWAQMMAVPSGPRHHSHSKQSVLGFMVSGFRV